MIEQVSPWAVWVLQGHLFASMGAGFCAYQYAGQAAQTPHPAALGPSEERTLRIGLIGTIMAFWLSVLVLVVVWAPVSSFLIGMGLFLLALVTRRAWSILHPDIMVTACLAFFVQGWVMFVLAQLVNVN
jgi:hypothetical protein